MNVLFAVSEASDKATAESNATTWINWKLSSCLSITYGEISITAVLPTSTVSRISILSGMSIPTELRSETVTTAEPTNTLPLLFSSVYKIRSLPLNVAAGVYEILLFVLSRETVDELPVGIKMTSSVKEKPDKDVLSPTFVSSFSMLISKVSP